jgi:U3 small nucleolar ribonucleoprotein protein IMP3
VCAGGKCKVGGSAFCRRRIAGVMTRLWMCETVNSGVKITEHGSVREVITGPAYLVPRYILQAYAPC